MNKDSIAEKTRRILRTDRLELMREHADKQATYCFYASMYEVAYHIHGDKLPPRFIEAENQWLSFGTEDHGGKVPPEELFSLLVRLANELEIKIEKIYANPSALERFLKDKVKDANIINRNRTEKSTSDDAQETTKEDAPSYKAHAESQTYLNKSDHRIQESVENGWFAVFAITFADKPNISEKTNWNQFPLSMYWERH